MSIYVADTHALIFFANQKYSQLSKKALRAFQAAENGEAYIYIPVPVLWEASILEKIRQVKFSKPFAEWVKDLVQMKCYEVVPLDAEIIIEARDYGFNEDIFDAAIVATAKLKDVPLITKDVAITNSGLVDIYW